MDEQVYTCGGLDKWVNLHVFNCKFKETTIILVLTKNSCEHNQMCAQ